MEWTPDKIEHRRVDELVPYARNARTHSDAQVALIAGSIRSFGFVNPVLIWRDEIVAGHGRVMAAQRLRMPTVPCVSLDHLSDTERRAYVLADNRLAELSGWDDEMLAAELDALKDEDVDLSALGFEEPAIEAPADSSSDDLGEPLEDAPTFSEVGQWYELGPHRLFCGDSTAIDPGSPFAMVFDPPFNVDYLQWRVPASASVVAVWGRGGGFMKWVVASFPEACEPEPGEWGMHQLLFTGGVRGQHNHTLPACMHELVTVLRRKWWTDKMEALDRGVLAASGAKVCTDGRHYSWQEGHGGVLTNVSHGMSWGKPTFEYELVMAYTPSGAAIWDPCAGSGSSLLASAKHGRVWTGAEMQPRWADLIRRRWTRWARETGTDPGLGALE